MKEFAERLTLLQPVELPACSESGCIPIDLWRMSALEEDAAKEVVCGGTWNVCFSRRTPLRVLRGRSGSWTGDRTSRYLDSGIPHSLQGGRKKPFDLVMCFSA
jgi:hypothetical protein